jgi:ribonuclease J
LALEELEEAAEAAFKRLGRDDREDDEIVEQSLMRAVRKAAEKVWRKRPLVDVSVLRI